MGSCGISESQVKLGLRKQRKLHFSAHEQLTDCGTNQTVGSGNKKPIEALQPVVPRMGRHINFSSTHNPRSTEGRPGESKADPISCVTNRSGR